MIPAQRSITVESRSPEHTRELGQRLGAVLRAGNVVALIGPLGAGKTALVKGVAAGAGVTDPRQVNSPTFVIINEYRVLPAGGGLRIYHVDAYRLRGGDDLEALGFDELCTQGAVLVEWAERVADVLPPDRLEIRIQPTGDTYRTLHCAALGPEAHELLVSWTRD